MNKKTDTKLLLTEPDTVDRYLSGLIRCIETSALNSFYPPANALLDSLDMMVPIHNGNLYPQLELHSATGLPTYKEFVRVATDKANAPAELPQLLQWKDATGSDIYDVLARKFQYYRELTAIDAVLLESGRSYFRKIDKRSAVALFRIVLDRITVQGYLERLTVELGQRNDLWGSGALKVDDMDAAAMSASLQGIVYRMAAQDPEVIFVRLNEDPALSVETVVKGTIGPYISSLTTPEARYSPLLPVADSGAILCLASATASIAQTADVFNDPFHLSPQFSKEARLEFAASIGCGGYHVLTDRKFVLKDAARPLLKEFLRSVGTENIIYEAADD